MKALVFAASLLLWPATAAAEETAEHLCGNWGVNVWGLSYHIDRTVDYNDANWGAGIRCYARPPWSLLGKNSENKLFVQVDALLNSHDGLLLPVSAGAEYKLAPLPGPCGLFFLGALTVAYYQNAVKNVADLKWGPVPGLAVGCGRVKSNVAFIPTTSGRILAAITASLTILGS